MSTQYQTRGGTTAENLLFTGAQRELTVDTDRHTVIVHDGITAGGYPLATGSDLDNGTFYYNEAVGSAANAYVLDPKPNTNVPDSYQDGIQFGFVTTFPNSGPSTANFQGLGVKNIKFPGGVDPQAGDVSGRVDLVYDAAGGWLELQRKATGTPPQLRSVTAAVGSNQLTVSLLPSIIDFRSQTLSSGTINKRTLTSTINLLVPAGATLGTKNATPERLALLAIDNAGTIQLAITNLSGGVNLDETTLIDTVAISAAATSASVVYAAASVSGVPFRVVGFVLITQAVAGTWVTGPAEVQGQGGQAIIGGAKLAVSSSLPLTSGTSVDFTGIPSWARRITLIIDSGSTSGTTGLKVQLGTVSAAEATGYLGGSSRFAAAAISTSTDATGLMMDIGSDAAAAIKTGTVIIQNLSGNTWVMAGSIQRSNGAGGGSSNASKTLASVLGRVRVTTGNGTDTLTAGTANILCEG